MHQRIERGMGMVDRPATATETVRQLVDALKFIVGIASIDFVRGGPIGYHAMIHCAYTRHSRKNDEMKRLCHATVDAPTIRQSFGALLLIAEHFKGTELESVEAFDSRQKRISNVS